MIVLNVHPQTPLHLHPDQIEDGARVGVCGSCGAGARTAGGPLGPTQPASRTPAVHTG